MDEQKQLLPMLHGKEIRFEVPWGFIAAKEYGDPNGIPVLAIHGWLDNCGSFDPLLPYIVAESNLHVVSIDEPGCGLSSHKPVGSDYGRWATLKDMKRIIEFMGWKSVTLLGHSQGGHYSLVFAALYPNLVERVISIDMFKPLTLRLRKPNDSIVGDINMVLRYEDKVMKNVKAPVYSEEDAVKKWMESTAFSVNESSAKILMKRGSKPCDNGVIFTRDIRLRLRGIEPLPSNEVMLTILSNLRCDLLIISAKQKPNLELKSEFETYYDCYKKYCRIFQYVSLDGTHHLHMNDPDLVGPVVNKFISESLSAGPLNVAKHLASKL